MDIVDMAHWCHLPLINTSQSTMLRAIVQIESDDTVATTPLKSFIGKIVPVPCNETGSRLLCFCFCFSASVSVSVFFCFCF